MCLVDGDQANGGSGMWNECTYFYITLPSLSEGMKAGQTIYRSISIQARKSRQRRSLWYWKRSSLTLVGKVWLGRLASNIVFCSFFLHCAVHVKDHWPRAVQHMHRPGLLFNSARCMLINPLLTLHTLNWFVIGWIGYSGWFSTSPLPRLHHHDIMTNVGLFFIYVPFVTKHSVLLVR